MHNVGWHVSGSVVIRQWRNQTDAKECTACAIGPQVSDCICKTGRYTEQQPPVHSHIFETTPQLDPYMPSSLLCTEPARSRVNQVALPAKPYQTTDAVNYTWALLESHTETAHEPGVAIGDGSTTSGLTSRYFSANSSILGINSSIRKGLDTTSSYRHVSTCCSGFVPSMTYHSRLQCRLDLLTSCVGSNSNDRHMPNNFPVPLQLPNPFCAG